MTTEPSAKELAERLKQAADTEERRARKMRGDPEDAYTMAALLQDAADALDHLSQPAPVEDVLVRMDYSIRCIRVFLSRIPTFNPCAARAVEGLQSHIDTLGGELTAMRRLSAPAGDKENSK